MGVISPVGLDKEIFWANLTAGKSGISKVELFDTSKYNRHFGAEIKDFNAADHIPKELIKFLGRASCFSISAAKLAFSDAGLKKEDYENKDAAVIMGVTIPEGNTIDLSSEMLLKEKLDDVTRKTILNIFAPSIARNMGRFFKIKGINLLIPNACSAGNYSIGYGFDLIRSGRTDMAVVGGSEALSRIAYQGFQKLFAMAHEFCAPFDKNRKGMLLGEGSGVLVLESLERARKRKATVYAEVLGYGLSCDAQHMTAPKRSGIGKCMKKALDNSGVNVDDVDYICAHGTGTIANDKEEAGAIKDLFGKRRVPVSSPKSMIGHCMGAASAIEAIACCLAIRDGIIPPTINFQTPDPECDIDCVPNEARKAKVDIVLNNGFAFGGNNCCVVLGRLR